MLKNLMFKNGLIGACLFSLPAAAAEISVKQADVTGMEVSIYNQNLAMVKDTRKAVLPEGESLTAFEGVATQMKPETALLQAAGVKVLEQNYEYDLLDAVNILEESIGQEVKTVMVNPSDGSNIFNKAIIVNGTYGQPILKFNYGIETNFPGRVVYEKLPENLRVKPTLAVKIDNVAAGEKEISLTYLTNGLSWSADYVAEVSGKNQMKLDGRVTLNNQSGTDYKNASVQLIAGSVNQETQPQAMPRANLMMAAKSTGFDAVAESAPAGGLTAENLSGYYTYTLPFKTDIMDKQTKQVNLMTQPEVKFLPLYKLTSPLYIGAGSGENDFENAHPQQIYKIANTAENGLGLPLPAGTVRFYEKNSAGVQTFIGAAEMPRLAVNGKTELSVGEVFDIFAEGKVKTMKKLADNLYSAEVEVTFHNAKDSEETVEFVQNFGNAAEIVKESETGEQVKSRSRQWKLVVPAGGEKVLTYQVNLARK